MRRQKRLPSDRRMIEGETSTNRANAGGNSSVLQTWEVRRDVEEDVEVTVSVQCCMLQWWSSASDTGSRE